MDNTLTIADVATATGTTHRALRFYEGRGLLTPARDARNPLVRIYTPAHIATVKTIQRWASYGLILAEIADAFAMPALEQAQYLAQCGPVIDAKIDALTTARAALNEELAQYRAAQQE